MRRVLYLGLPVTIFIISILFIWFGEYVYAYRDHLHTTDPTTYHLNSLVTASILIPAGISFFLSAYVIVHRITLLERAPKQPPTE